MEQDAQNAKKKILHSGSVWTGVILHASHNLFLQQVLDPLTVDKGGPGAGRPSSGWGCASTTAS